MLDEIAVHRGVVADEVMRRRFRREGPPRTPEREVPPTIADLSTQQRDLYALAAFLDRKPLTVPKTSTVPAAFFDKKDRESLIRVTLKPGEPVAPAWPFEKMCGSGDGAELEALLQDPGDPRERLAALITAPQNERFARVIANRVWKRLIGAGLVEPVHDWEGRTASHPELLDWLACELVAHDYDLHHLVRLVMTSQVYQREATVRI